MKILLTGACGFLGKAMQEQWKNTFEIITLCRNKNAMLNYDIATEVPDIPSIDMVMHAAGKAHIVPKNEEERKDFFTVNVQGTKNLLDALENKPLLKKFVFISSVAVYGLNEGINITEHAPLLATDPYGKSKIAAEKLVIEWCIERNIDYYILRLPLIAGKNSPGNLGAMVKGIKSSRYISIGKAVAKKSMVLAKDVADFIAHLEGASGVYNLTDGYHPSFRELEKKISGNYNKNLPITLPVLFAKIIGYSGDLLGNISPINSNKIKKIISTLTFDDSRARKLLNWHPNSVLDSWEIN